jgi:adenine-specific DNA-methyltransferase
MAEQPKKKQGSVTKTELIWDGKYDKDGKRVAPLRVALPFQTVETVNESAQERQKNLLFESRTAYGGESRNRLIWGDKKYVLPSLLPEFAGKVNLIYIDPPFDTGADFSFTATVPDHPDTPEDDSFAFEKEPSIIEQKAYRDTWGRGLNSYLEWFYETVVLLHELLHESGSVYVHLDYHVSHYAKTILDEVLGVGTFQNEIIWKRQSAHSDAKRYGPIHDTILFYSKTSDFSWIPQHEPLAQEYIDAFFTNIDENGRRFARGDLTAPGPRPNLEYEWRGYSPPKGRCWAVPLAKLERYYVEGRIFFPKKGIPRLKRYPEESPGVPLQDIWTNVRILHNQSPERVGYPTQKPEGLLERIIKSSSNAGDLVLDCFCGSGTTAAVAEKLGRRWIACDLGRYAVHTTRKRLLSIPNVRPFVVQNLGKYERQLWAGVEFGRTEEQQERSAEQHEQYVEFILKLYNAKPLRGYAWLHGARGGRMVHVGSVDAPVSVGDVRQIAAEFKKAIGTGKDAPKTNGVDVLGWDFAFEMNEVALQQAAAANIQVKFLRIPRDVMDKRAVEQGDIKFFELAALSVGTKVKGREVTLRLTDFVIPPDDVPEEARKAVKHWSQWIDYWAVDWDYKGDTFHNEWQTYRTRKDPKLAPSKQNTPTPRKTSTP